MLTGIATGETAMDRELMIAMRDRDQLRIELNKLLAAEKRDEDKIAEVRAKYDAAETKHNDLLTKQIETSEARQTDQRTNGPKVELRNYLNAYANSKKVEGAEAEWCQELGLDPQTQVPLVAFEHAPVEQRQDMTGSSPVIDTANEPVLKRVFPMTAATHLGVRMTTVPSGQAGFPVFASGAEGAEVDEDAAQDAEAYSITTSVLSARRLTARYLWSVEDQAGFAGLENELRADLSGVFGQLMDKKIVDDLFTALTDATEATKLADWDIFSDALTGAVDGIYAGSADGVRVLWGKDTYQLAAKTFKANTPAPAAATLYGPRAQVSSYIPAVANKKQKAIRSLGDGTAVAPVWEGVQFIRDPYTNAAKGQIALTGIMLMNFKLVRAAAWAELEFQVTA